MLIEAGIKVWVLTGDKVETAITIALTAHLFDETMSLVEVRERDFEGREDNEAQAQVRGGGAGRGAARLRQAPPASAGHRCPPAGAAER